MSQSVDELEARMADLRAQVREASRTGDKSARQRLRAELREVNAAWEDALDREAGEADVAATRGPEPPRPTASAAPPSGMSVPVREQAHQALTLLGAPASPKLISAAHEAFLTGPIVTTKLGSLRRDEERSFNAQPYARPYYVCAALTHDRLGPARGLLAVSTWPLERRIIGPLSPRVDFLTHAIRVAEEIQRVRADGRDPGAHAWRLLRRFAVNVPGADDGSDPPDPERVAERAAGEVRVHADADAAERREAAVRTRDQLPDVQQLFGAPRLGIAAAPAEHR
ncbi:hypothetical protein [Streptomyces sp. B6B3]|uniref:hypothetical protein n=1 Tax=Streptomyces sp. B6B3 TaxID=3153570 RepID=UPI00325D4C06